MSAHTTDGSDDDSPHLERRYVRLLGERDHDGHTYRLRGLPEGEDFRLEDSYETIHASMLSVEGIGFAANAFEFSQHERTVVVTQQIEHGSVNITFE